VRIGTSSPDGFPDAEILAHSGFVGVAFIQLANHIAQDLPVHRCANEKCQQIFSIQRDRAKHGQYRRTGVTYCSAACARAQAQRQYRRRTAVESRSG
jgi:hypothetical protein